MLTIYGVYRSRASRPLWLLHECGAPFHHIPVIQAYRAAADPSVGMTTTSPAFLAVNPMGQIPVLVDGGLTLTESLAITLHLGRTRGQDMGPLDRDEDARMQNWALFAAASVEAPALEIMLAGRGGDTPDARAAMDIAAEKLRRPFARVEAQLAAEGHLTGGRFTVADINLAECVRYATGHPDLMAAFPAIAGWLARCQSRPAFQEMWRRRLAEPE
jgi:glutathione S-transferase